MLARKYEMPWRTAYELYAGYAWCAATVAIFALPNTPVVLKVVLLIPCLARAIQRLRQGMDVLRVRASLMGRAMELISMKRFYRLTSDQSEVFFGYGFEWQPVHSQRLYDLAKVDYKQYTVAPVALRLLGFVSETQPDEEIGLAYIHGVESEERPLYRPLQNFEGGTLIVGTTQAGKGVALGCLIAQAIRRGDITIVIDPKNSQRLRNIIERACNDFRDPDTFLSFHPAFPERGVRLDFMFNWQKPTEIASRIQSIMPPDKTGAFSAFGWDAVNVVVGGLIDLEERPNLAKLTKYIEGGVEPVLEESLRRFYARELGDQWRSDPDMRRLFEKAGRGQLKPPTPAASGELVAMVEYYEHHLHQDRRDKVIDSQVRTFRHNREHYQKITASLLPILSMLTSGDLGRSLSPQPFDAADKRPIMNYEKIEQGGHVLLLCLDSLPDPSVASAIGALALADLAARAGMRYNLGLPRRISLFVDEATNVINQPLIEILNKGAEGGIYTTLAMQTLSDLADRLGSVDAARKALGNLNNLYAFRSKDRPTQDFIVETFGETSIHTMRVGINTGMDGHIGEFSAGHSTQISETTEERVPSWALGQLPNLQYFASIGGRLSKGRFVLLDAAAPPASIPTTGRAVKARVVTE